MTRTLRNIGPSLITIILALILSGWASAATIKLGPVREQTISWLMASQHLSRAAAEQMVERYARRNRAEIADEVEVPDGAVLDFVEVDASGHGGTQVHSKGCGAFFSGGSIWPGWRASRGRRRTTTSRRGGPTRSSAGTSCRR
jgi:hypothetical protein